MVAVVGERLARELVSLADAIEVTEAAFVALAHGRTLLFPAVRGHGSDPATRFGVKAGYDAGRRLPGLKVGTWWPDNRARGLDSHGSTTLLLDDATGRVGAIVAATHLTALRTAAADAVAVKHLARADATVLALFGTGRQAYHDALAIAQVRRLQRILVCGRAPDAADALVRRLREAGLPAETASPERAVADADIVSTVTASQRPLFAAEWIRPGSHVSAMGADGPGKQELPPDLVAAASLWAEAPAQSVAIGEFQHAAAAGRIAPGDVRCLGEAIDGVARGRRDEREITIFDSSGVAAQDLAICALALERAVASGAALRIDLD